MRGDATRALPLSVQRPLHRLAQKILRLKIRPRRVISSRFQKLRPDRVREGLDG